MQKYITTIILSALFVALTACGVLSDSDHSTEEATADVQSRGYQTEAVPFARDGKTIYGELLLPESSGPHPVVVIAHGFGGNLTQVSAYAEAFAENGIAAYAFDFIGGGRGSRSDGKMVEMSVLTEAADMNAVLDGLLAREDIDPENIFLLGGSQGGFVATYVAGTRPEDVKGLVALYPAYVLQDDAWRRTPDPNDIPETMNLMGSTIGRIYNEDAMSFDIYLKKPVKRQVDEILDALEDFPIVRECYDRWLDLQGQVDSYYKDVKRKRVKLSEQKEFRQIKNAVIAVADQINKGVLTFEDERMRERDEPDNFEYAPYVYHQLHEVIANKKVPLEERDECVEELTQLAEDGEQHAQYLLGTLYRDGGLLIPDDEQAEKWFRRSAEQGNGYAAYALGKLLLSDDAEVHNAEEGMRWLETAAQSGVDYAAYLLGKEYLRGKNVERDAQIAVAWFQQAADAGNPFAQYALGKLYLDGDLVQKDMALGMAYMERAAQQGNAYAQFFVDRQDSLKPPSIMLSVTRLLHHLGSIFQDNSLPQSGSMRLGIDQKRMQELIDQKGYQAARDYAREQQQEQQYSGPTMSTPW